MKTNLELKDLIRNKRREMGLTQEQLAELLCVDVMTVSKWERGKTIPKKENLDRLGLFEGHGLLFEGTVPPTIQSEDKDLIGRLQTSRARREMYSEPRIISLLGSLTDALPDEYPYMSESRQQIVRKLLQECLRITGGEGS